MSREIKHIGIIGGGKMGTNLFFFLSGFDFRLSWYTRSGIEKKRKKLERKLKRFDPEGKDILFENYNITEDLKNLGDVDMVIECIDEDLNIKQELFEKLHKIVKSKAIFTTISSSIVPEKLFLNNNRDSSFVGMHFFYPLEIKNVVEIIKTDITNKQVLEKITEFINIIGKKPFYQDCNSAFVLNRIMLSIQDTSCKILINESYNKDQIDDVITNHLFPIGVFSMIEQIGIEVLKKSLANYYKSHSESAESIKYYLENPEAFSSNISSNITEKEAEKIVKLLKKAYFDKLTYICKKYGFSKLEVNAAMFDYLGEDPNNWEK